eukprot:jgi/Orpsp1_1/1184912/evm.model.c7180000091503.1
MKLLNFGLLFIWMVLFHVSLAKEYTKEDYIEIAENYISEKFNNTSINCKYRVVIDTMAYVYIDELAGDIPIRYLDSVIMINKETLEIFHANLKIKTEIYERYVEGEEPLSLQEIPEFINQLNYEGKYEIDTDNVKVVQKKNYNNYYDIKDIPYVLIEKDSENSIEVEVVYEPITRNNNGDVFELAYYIKYRDENDDYYSIILFANTKI